MQNAATAPIIAVDGNDDFIGNSKVGVGGDAIEQQEERQMNRHIPWQMEWKHPQWITSSPPSPTEKDRSENDDAEVVGITSARLSQLEISHIRSFKELQTNLEDFELESKHVGFGKEKDSHYLLTVTLLGRSTHRTTLANEYGSTTIGETEKILSKSLASEVLLEVLDVPNSNHISATATRVIQTKRLRWPESIFDGAASKSSQNEATATNATRKKKSAKRKNLLASIFLPLIGIDEEDEYVRGNERPGAPENDETKSASAQISSASSAERNKPTVGIVSATLCRRPREGQLGRTKASATKDIVELMSFGTVGDGGGVGTIGHGSVGVGTNSEYTKGSTRSDASEKDVSKNRDYSPTEEIQLLSEGSTLEDNNRPKNQHQNRDTEDCGELSFLCVSQGGDVFVYDPIKLLLGIEDVSNLDDGEMDAKKGLEDISNFFFGQQLFQNLQETWKPLAEPSTRIHLSLFEHAHQKKNSGVTLEHSLQKAVQTNQELSDLAQSVLSKDDKSTGTSSRSKKDMTLWKRQQRHGKIQKNNGSEGSAVTFHSGDGGDSSTGATYATDALTAVQTIASELQTGVDEALSMLPYLLNPLLEPSTLKDRTVQNMPLEITVTGSAYVVVTGSGLRMKQQRDHQQQRNGSASFVSASINSNLVNPSLPGSPQKSYQSVGETQGANEATVVSRHANAHEQDIVGNLFSDFENVPENVNEKTNTNTSTNDSQLGQNGLSANKNNEGISDRDASPLIYGDDCEINDNDITDNDVEDTNIIRDGNVMKSNKAIQKGEMLENYNTSYQEDNDIYIEDSSKLDYDNNDKTNGTTDQGAWWENESVADKDAEDNLEGISKHDDDNKNEIEGAPWWENDSAADQMDNAHNNIEDKSNRSGVNGNNTDGGISKGEWWAKESADDQEDNVDNNIEDSSKLIGANENEIKGATEKDARSDYDSANDQDHNNSDKTSVSSQIESAIKNDDDNSQRHYFDGYENEPEGYNVREHGGFVTFLSTERWSETRTLFLPFVPIRSSHIPQWNGMELLWIIGEFDTLLIRIDSTGPVPVRIGDIMFGERVSNRQACLFQTATASNRTTSTDGIGSANELSPLSVKKFQILPIDLGVPTSTSTRLLCASNSGIDPPSVLELHIDKTEEIITGNQPRHQNEHNQKALVLLKTLGYCTPQGTVVLHHTPSHMAKIAIDHDDTMATADNSEDDVRFLENGSMWAEHGQGWSLVGSNRRINYICWEGSTLLQGAYVKEFNNSHSFTPCNFHTTHVLPLSVTRDGSLETASSHPHSKMGADEVINSTRSEREKLFNSPQQFSSDVTKLPVIDEFHRSLSRNLDKDGQFGGYIFSPKGTSGLISDLSKNTNFSRRQNREYLLQQCSSWTQLEDFSNDRIMLERQEPILCLRSGKVGSPHSMLSLRQLVVDNGIASPFQQVLAWLAKRNNFFVAAGIALELLRDADSLYHLWKHAEMIDEEDEETKIFGLLDGIAPVRLLDDNRRANEFKHNLTATHLSEMTVGCFIKGGTSMSKTLVRFLESNKLYDPERVSLMLSLTTMDLFSANSREIRNSNTLNSGISNQEETFDDLIWPIKCLLSIGTEREYLSEVLALLNNTIPDELRHRYSKDEKEEQKTSMPSLNLTKKLIKLILESDPFAVNILMNFVDDRSRGHFWQSLDHEARLALSLMNINNLYPFLGHPDGRAWARGELDSCFQGESNLPTIWLQELSLACLRNASCDLENLRVVDHCDDRLLDSAPSKASDATCVTSTHVPVFSDLDPGKPNTRDKYIGKMQFENENTRNALLSLTNRECGVDYDLLIPTLLLLENRNVHWLPPTQLPSSEDKPFVPTQSLLDAACHLAGRAPNPSSDAARVRSSTFPRDQSDDGLLLFAEFDSKSAMMQCYRAKNVVAAAHLIGGRNGFILHICDVLNRGIGISIRDSEKFLLNDQLNLKIIEESKTETSSFELSDGHKKLLLLFDETVLVVKTFGDFDFVHNRGRVDPIFAARSILRAWLSLSFADKATASSWLGNWLRDRLGIQRIPSSVSSPNADTNDATPLSKATSAHSSDTDDVDTINNREGDRGKDAVPHRHRLACASLARSLLWPNNEETSKTAGTGDADGVPLAATMEFETQLLIQICQSCLGLVESVPPAILREIQI